MPSWIIVLVVSSRHFSEFCVYQSTPMPKRSVCAGAGGGGGAHPRPPGHQAQHARVLAPAESPGQAVGLLPGDTQILFSSVTGGQSYKTKLNSFHRDVVIIVELNN